MRINGLSSGPSCERQDDARTYRGTLAVLTTRAARRLTSRV